MKKRVMKITAITCIACLAVAALSACSSKKDETVSETSQAVSTTGASTTKAPQTTKADTGLQTLLCSETWYIAITVPGDSYSEITFQNDNTVIEESIGNESSVKETGTYTVSDNGFTFSAGPVSYSFETTPNSNIFYGERNYNGEKSTVFLLKKADMSTGTTILEGKEGLHSAYLSKSGYDDFYSQTNGQDAVLLAKTQAADFEMSALFSSAADYTSYYNYNASSNPEQPQSIAFVRGDGGQLHAYLFFTDGNVIEETW